MSRLLNNADDSRFNLTQDPQITTEIIYDKSQNVSSATASPKSGFKYAFSTRILSPVIDTPILNFPEVLTGGKIWYIRTQNLKMKLLKMKHLLNTRTNTTQKQVIHTPCFHTTYATSMHIWHVCLVCQLQVCQLQCHYHVYQLQCHYYICQLLCHYQMVLRLVSRYQKIQEMNILCIKPKQNANCIRDNIISKQAEQTAPP